MASKIDNPLLRLYDAVYELLFEDTPQDPNLLATLFKPGNRVSYGSKFEGSIKDRPVTADMPELILMDEGGSLNLHANSSQAEYNPFLSLYISTGSFNYAGYASAINWFLICRLVQWKQKLTKDLKWNGLPYVKNIMVIPIQIGETNPERSRDIKGLVCIWRMQIMLRISNELITQQETVRND